MVCTQTAIQISQSQSACISLFQCKHVPKLAIIYSSPRVHRVFMGTFRHIRCSTRWLTFVTFHMSLEPFLKTVITIILHLSMPLGINSQLSSPSVAIFNHCQPWLHQHVIQVIAAFCYSDQSLAMPGINTSLELYLFAFASGLHLAHLIIHHGQLTHSVASYQPFQSHIRG